MIRCAILTVEVINIAQKYQWFNGKRFTRDEDTGYYLNSTMHKRLHVYVYEFYNGEVPDGCEIHHRDLDRANNSIDNLECLTMEAHKKLHAELLTDAQRERRRNNLEVNARPKAVEWHKSKDGREWHRLHAQHCQEALHRKFPKKCLWCGGDFVGETKAKFCSNQCKSAYRRASGADKVERICVICGTKFETDRYDDVQCCSKKCGAILGHRRRRESKIS